MAARDDARYTERMDEAGGVSFESLLIVATAVSLFLGGVAGFKASQPKRWNDLSVAASDLWRDYGWQAQQAAARWKADPVAAFKGAWNDSPTPDVGSVTLRPAADPLAQIKSYR